MPARIKLCFHIIDKFGEKERTQENGGNEKALQDPTKSVLGLFAALCTVSVSIFTLDCHPRGENSSTGES